jgi:predicted AAA+ superfamily ATPase
MEGNPEKKTVILDEVQKLPDLLDFVHKIIEENKEDKIHPYRIKFKKVKKKRR